MKFIKIFAVLLLLVPVVSFARGAVSLPVHPTASITVGGQSTATITTGKQIPLIRWGSARGASFRSYLNVNNSALCNGIKNNQAWGQARTAAGSFNMGIAPKAREGCVLTITYEVTSRTGHKAVDRIVLRYTAPKVAPKPPVKPPVTPVDFNPKVEIVLPNGETQTSNKLRVEWKAENINSDYEFNVYLHEVDKGELNLQLGRLRSGVRSESFEIPSEAFNSNYEVVIFVTKGGADTLLGAKKFYSKTFELYRSSIDDGGMTDTSLQILSPGKGDIFGKGDVMQIRWSGYEKDFDFYSIHLIHENSSYERIIATNVEVNPSESKDVRLIEWTIPTDIDSSNYRVEFRGKAFSKETGLFSISDSGSDVKTITTKFISESSSVNNDQGTSRDYVMEFNITPATDIYLTKWMFTGNTSNISTTTPGLYSFIEGPVGGYPQGIYSVDFGPSYIPPVIANGLTYYKLPANITTKVAVRATVQNVQASGQYRVNIVGFNYVTDPWQNTQYSKRFIFADSPENTLYRTSYRTINSASFGFKGFWGLGSVIGGFLNLIGW